MFDSIDRLDQEIINIQVLDHYYKDDLIRYDKYFLREDYEEQMKKFEQVLEQYEDEDDKLQVVEEIEDSACLDDVMETLVADLDIYSSLYKVPEVSIKDDEWELLFYTIGEYFLDLDLDYLFFDTMVDLNKWAIAKSMVYEEESISLQTYISSLRYLESDILTIGNIKELAGILGKEFKIDAISLVANRDGNFGMAKSFENLPVCEEMQEKINSTMPEEDDGNKTSIDTGSNVISFTKFKKRKVCIDIEG